MLSVHPLVRFIGPFKKLVSELSAVFVFYAWIALLARNRAVIGLTLTVIMLFMPVVGVVRLDVCIIWRIQPIKTI